jgi:hypothetical protein
MPMTTQSVPQRLHEQMHQLPGVPEHSEGEKLNHRGGLPNRPRQGRGPKSANINRPHVAREPRVLVGWQSAIGRLFSRSEKH